MTTLDLILALAGFATVVAGGVWTLSLLLHTGKTEILTAVAVLTERVHEIKHNDLGHIHDRLTKLEATLLKHLTRNKS